MNAFQYAFFPCIFASLGVGFWLGMKAAERDDRRLRGMIAAAVASLAARKQAESDIQPDRGAI